MDLTTFEDWLRARGRSERTIQKYKYILNRLPENILLNPIKVNEYLIAQKYEPRNTYNFVSTLSTYYTFRGQSKLAKKLIKPKITGRNLNSVTLEMYYTALERSKDDPEMQIILSLLMECGWRPSILTNSLVGWINLQDLKIYVPGDVEGNKAKEPFVSLITPRTRDLLVDWIQSNKLKRTDYILQIKQKNKPEYIWIRLKKLAKKLGFESWLSAKMFRRGHASAMIDIAGIRSTQMGMGQKKLESMNPYLVASDKTRRKGFKDVFDKD